MTRISSLYSPSSFFGGLAHHKTKHIWLAFEIRRARAIADRGNGHRRLRAEGIAQRGDNGRASGRDEFFLHAI